MFPSPERWPRWMAMNCWLRVAMDTGPAASASPRSRPPRTILTTRPGLLATLGPSPPNRAKKRLRTLDEVWVRHHCRPTQCWQVHFAQQDPRHQGLDHLGQAKHNSFADPWRLEPPRGSGGVRRHPRTTPPEDPPG